jgi:ribonuclease D
MMARLAERDLDDTTREECEALELRSRRTADLLGELEYRMINKVQQQRKPIRTDTR